MNPDAAGGQSIPTLNFGEPRPDALTVDLGRLLVSRLFISASSNGGKSYALRYMLEQTHGRIQQMVIDPEGEFASLRERFDYLLVGSEGEIPAIPSQAHMLARRIMSLGASTIFDLADLAPDNRHLFIRNLLRGLIDLPKEEWRAVMVVLDEFHIYAPETGKGQSIAKEAVIDEANLGRKRAQLFVGASQRIANVSNDALAAFHNKLVGLTTLDTDVSRAGRDLGFARATDRQQLQVLEPGSFFALGPAFGLRRPTLVRTGQVQTTHPEPGSVIPPAPPAPAAIRALVSQLQDLPTAAASELDMEGAQARIAALEAALHSAQAERNVERGPEVPQRLKDADHEAAQHRTTISRLEALLHAKNAEIQGLRNAPPRLERVPILTAADTVLLGNLHGQLKSIDERWHQDLADAIGQMTDVRDRIQDLLTQVAVREATAPVVPEPVVSLADRRAGPSLLAESEEPEPPATNGHAPAPGRLRSVRQRILDALATLAQHGLSDVDRDHLAIQAGWDGPIKSYTNTLGTLSSAGLIEYPSRGRVALSAAGRTQAHANQALRVTPHQQPILDTLASFAELGIEPVDKASIDAQVMNDLAPYRVTSARSVQALSQLVQFGMVTSSAAGFSITELGWAIAHPGQVRSLDEYQKAWGDRLGGKRAVMLHYLVCVYPQRVQVDDLCDVADCRFARKSFTNMLGELRSMGLATPHEHGRSDVATTELLFPQSLVAADRVRT